MHERYFGKSIEKVSCRSKSNCWLEEKGEKIRQVNAAKRLPASGEGFSPKL
jgi:hypothetical protein